MRDRENNVIPGKPDVRLATFVLVSALILTLTGCSGSNGTSPEQIDGSSLVAPTVYVDPYTGVNYLRFGAGYGCSVCVRINADGTPYVSEVDE